MMSTLSDKMFGMQTIFFHFINNAWVFSLDQSDVVWKNMSLEEREMFNIDINTYEVGDMFMHNIYGIQRYYLKEDVIPLEANYKQLLQKNRVDWFHDLRVAQDATSQV